MAIKKYLSRCNPRTIHAFATLSGLLVATGLMTVLLWKSVGKEGIEEPAKLIVPTFKVAMMAGARDESKQAKADIETVVEEKTVEATPVATQVVTESTASSLPDAVEVTAQPVANESLPVEVVQEAEVIPPAQIAMPGGKLMAVDVDLGSQTPEIFSIAKNEVILRYLVNKEGIVERGGVFRSGSEPLRDVFIHKAMKSRIYTVKDWPKVQEGENPLWMVELTVPYNKHEDLVLP